MIALAGRIVMSWIPTATGGASHGIAVFLIRVTEPVLGPVRRVLPPVTFSGMGIDLSPIVVWFGIIILQRILC